MEDRIDDDVRLAVLRSVVEGKKPAPKPSLSERTELKVDETALTRVTEDKVVSKVMQKAHDFPIGIFWYDTKNDILDYTPYTEGLHHSKTEGYSKYAEDPFVLRGRVFKDGQDNIAFIYVDDFKSMEHMKSKLSSLARKLSEKDNIKYLVSEYGEDLLEKVKAVKKEGKSVRELLAESLDIRVKQNQVEDSESGKVREVAIKAAKFNVIKGWRF